MDVNTILEVFEEKKTQYFTFSGDELISSLNLIEYVDIEDKKSNLFLNRIDFICMANSLKVAMQRESGYKQLKRYLTSECGMSAGIAQHYADKYNEGSRIYNKFPLIVNNCARCHGIDIRDLTLKELSSDWYAAARDNPALVANIMNQISDRIVRESQYTC